LKGDGRSLVPSSPLSGQISKEMKRRGFKFVGPTIVYAWMQAVGIVNDHSVGCFRRAQVSERKPSKGTLEALIAREQARRLARLGGSEPGLRSIPRRRTRGKSA
jgi:hypothetical protein